MCRVAVESSGKVEERGHSLNFFVSPHARKEMVRRLIPATVLDSVLQNPDQVVPEKYGCKAYQSRVNFSGKVFLVRAIVNDAVDPAVVVTVYRTTRIHKYWRMP
jgi:hypothetical protein